MAKCCGTAQLNVGSAGMDAVNVADVSGIVDSLEISDYSLCGFEKSSWGHVRSATWWTSQWHRYDELNS